MDQLWTPWRYAYTTGQDSPARKGVPAALAAFPNDHHSVFLNLIGSVQWAERSGGMSRVEAEKAGNVLLQAQWNFVCLNAYPYTSGHLMVVPYARVASLAAMPAEAASEMMSLAQRMEGALRKVYRPHGINLGMNLGEAAGAGVADHLHLHMLPRWVGDTNFMTVVGETRVLPEMLSESWKRLREALGEPSK